MHSSIPTLQFASRDSLLKLNQSLSALNCREGTRAKGGQLGADVRLGAEMLEQNEGVICAFVHFHLGNRLQWPLLDHYDGPRAAF